MATSPSPHSGGLARSIDRSKSLGAQSQSCLGFRQLLADALEDEFGGLLSFRYLENAQQSSAGRLVMPGSALGGSENLQADLLNVSCG